MQIDKLLTEWLAFAKDVQPSCAAGADQLDFLRASTEAELQKLNVSQNSGKPIVSRRSVQPKEIEEYFNKKGKRDIDDFGWTGAYCLSAKDVLDFIIDMENGG